MLNIALKAALQGAVILKENFGKIRSGDIREKSKNDFLTFVDEKSEERIIKTIQEQYPDHDFIGEEKGSRNPASRYKWIIDPLDGTKNYICGVPVFAVSIGLTINGQFALGVIYDVMRDEMYRAEKGSGAFLNENQIFVNQTETLQKSILGTGFPFRAKKYLRRYLDCFETVFYESSGMRRFGAAAIDLAYVASGKFEGFWELGLKPWDVAAGALIIKEAGGDITDFWGDATAFMDNTYVVATNGKIQKQLLNLINRHFKEPLSVY